MRTLQILTTTLALSIPAALAAQQELQGAGQVAVRAQSTFATSKWSWHDVPGLRSAITLPAGGDLAVTVNIRGRLSRNTDRMFLRLLVDGAPALPNSIPFLLFRPNDRTTTCTFFRTGLRPGPHKVIVQALMQSGTATLGVRNMVMRFAGSTSDGIRMATAYSGAMSRSSASGYADIPGASVNIDVPWPARLMILSTGHFETATSKVIGLRAVVNGTATGDRMLQWGPSHGARSVTLTHPRLARGKHTVKLQLHNSAAMTMSTNTLVVVAVRDQVNYKSGYLHQRLQAGWLRNSSTSWATIPGLKGGYIWVPSRCDVAIRFSGEIAGYAGSEFRLRCRFDSVVVPNGLDILANCWGQGDPQHLEKQWVVRNVERGWHYVSVDWATSTAGSIVVGDRNLTATALIGQRPLLVTATESRRPSGYKFGGTFANSVVDTVGSKRTFKTYVKQKLFGKVFPGVADWFAENARGHLHVVEAGVIGPNMKIFDEKTYRGLPNAFTAMKLEALTYADVVFDYSLYDRDGDGKVKPDELYTLVVFYQDFTFGEVRPLTYNTRDGVALDYNAGIATVYTPDFLKSDQLGVICHELCHLLLGAGDMYETSDPTAPGPFSIMDQHWYFGHLDPLHKIKQGRWYEPYAIGKDGWVTLDPVSKGGSLLKLHDPNSHKGEYFLAEVRNFSYDAKLPTRGLAVWHCNESRLPNWRTAVEIEPASGIGTTVDYSKYLFKGTEKGFDKARDVYNYSTHTNLRWHDKTPSNLGLFAIEALPDGRMRVFFDSAKPGVLVQFEKRELYLDGSGYAKTRVRVVNTSSVKNSFNINVYLTGYASWRQQYVTLQPYETRYFTLLLGPSDPNRPDVSITATGAGVSTTDTAKVYATLVKQGSGAIGTTVTLHLVNPEHKGAPYFMGAALGNTPGINIPGGLHVPLNNDPLLNSFHTSPSVFSRFFGRIGIDGLQKAYVNIPNVPGFRGLQLYFAYVTTNSSGTTFTSVSNGVGFKIR